MNLTVLTIDHKHGTNVTGHADSGDAEREVAEWVAQNFDPDYFDENVLSKAREADGADVLARTRDGFPITYDVVSEHFSGTMDDSYHIDTVSVPGLVAPDPRVVEWATMVTGVLDGHVSYGADGMSAVVIVDDEDGSPHVVRCTLDTDSGEVRDSSSQGSPWETGFDA